MSNTLHPVPRFPRAHVCLLLVVLAACGPSATPAATLAETRAALLDTSPADLTVNGGGSTIGLRATGYWGGYLGGTVGQGLVAEGGPGAEGGYFIAGPSTIPEARPIAVRLANGDLQFGP